MRGSDDIAGWAADLAGASAGRSPAEVLASVAAAIGVPWGGPAGAGGPGDVAVRVPDAPGWLVLDAARSALLEPGDRRRLGAHHTPPDLAHRLVALALDGARPGTVVCDPACGGGAFLVAAAEHLVAAGAGPALVVARQLVGFDVDPLAVTTARAALACWARDRGVEATADGVAAGDGLAAEWCADVVVGNPPFLSPLGADTGGGPTAAAMRQQLGAPYADVAALFLLRSLERVGLGGRVVLIQPESLLASRDARAVRSAVADHLEGLWVAGEPVFAASVRVCAPVLAEGRGSSRVQRWRGASMRSAGTARFDRTASTWSHLRPTTVPRVRSRRGPTVGEIATATAGFRDEFYGLAAAVTDGGDGQPLVTSGLIDPGRVRWGERPARIGGRNYAAPTVSIDAIDDRLRRWVDARLVPKVLVATQTRVLEAAPDPAGRFIPMTPVLAVTPNEPAEVWRLAAALTSPLVSAWALREFAGASMSSDALKVSAKQVLAAPLPIDVDAWAAATLALRAGDVVGCGTALAGADAPLLRWWCARLPSRTV